MKCYHILNWFSLPKKQFFGKLFEFSASKITSKSISPNSKSKSYQVNSINSSHQDIFKNTKCTFQFLSKFQLRFNLIFSEEIIQYSKTFAPQVQTSWNQSPCTPPPQELSKETKNTIWDIMVWWISYLQTKQTSSSLHNGSA